MSTNSSFYCFFRRILPISIPFQQEILVSLFQSDTRATSVFLETYVQMDALDVSHI